jgi:hypothetical protein
LVIPRGEEDCLPTGAATDIRHAVLVFMAATGDPVLVGVIFQSEKDVADLPPIWRLGIDVRKDLHEPADGVTTNNESKVWIENAHAMGCRPKCFFGGKEI